MPEFTLPRVGETLLRVEGLTKRYEPTTAVDAVDLAIPRGSIYGFLGPNGAGKTTAIRCVMGIILPDAGTVTLAGRPLDDRVRDRIGYLPEERGLYRKMKCLDQLAYLAELKGVPRREALRRADGWLDRLDPGTTSSARWTTSPRACSRRSSFSAR